MRHKVLYYSCHRMQHELSFRTVLDSRESVSLQSGRPVCLSSHTINITTTSGTQFSLIFLNYRLSGFPIFRVHLSDLNPVHTQYALGPLHFSPLRLWGKRNEGKHEIHTAIHAMRNWIIYFWPGVSSLLPAPMQLHQKYYNWWERK